MNFFALILLLGIIAVTPSKSQEDNQTTTLWDLGTIPYLLGCAKNGIALFPGIEDPWPLNAHCITHEGSVGCFYEEGGLSDTCRCNQRKDAAIFDQILNKCVGLVGAFCTAQHNNNSFFPEKVCTQFAFCKPLQEGPGRTVGKCECLYGYNATDKGRCQMDYDITNPSTMPTTTTPAPEESEDFKLPPLNLLIGVHVTNYAQECHARPVLPLNRTICNTYGQTVSCLDKKCQCNLQEDSIFDSELNMCVGRVGSYCLGRRNLLGYKACTKYADCQTDIGSWEDGYSFGTCQCAYGYNVDFNGLCEKNTTIPNPSTARPIVPPSTSGTGSTTPGGTGGTGSTTPGGTGGTVSTTESGSGVNSAGYVLHFFIYAYTLYIILN